MVEQTSIAPGLSTWEIDPVHTLVEFAARHMMITTIKGKFSGVKGTILTDEERPELSRVEVTIDTASLDTGDEGRDTHLKSADFLDVEHSPTIAFQSRRVVTQDAGRFKVVGDLTIRDVTREVVLDATFEGRVKSPWGDERAGFSARTIINRRDFGLTWNVPLETDGVVVGEEVNISLEIEAIRRV
ncbi:MAG: YceI like family [Dehalococcoidia bacterium]|nr:YceI like family [Dehalococcoidia bacterium]